MRAIFTTPPPLPDHTKEQRELFKSCRALEKEHPPNAWEPIQSLSKFVEMASMLGEDGIEYGRAIVVVDSSAKNTLAWWFRACDNERTRVSSEEGNPGEK